jgi:hypothetical protein
MQMDGKPEDKKPEDKKPEDKKPEEMNTDDKVAAGLQSRYTRTCECGAAIAFNALPGPTKCAKCLPPEPQKVP